MVGEPSYRQHNALFLDHCSLKHKNMQIQQMRRTIPSPYPANLQTSVCHYINNQSGILTINTPHLRPPRNNHLIPNPNFQPFLNLTPG